MLNGRKNIFVIFLKGSYHESQEHIANKKTTTKKPTPILSKRGHLCRVGMVKHFNSDDDCLGMCIQIALI